MSVKGGYYLSLALYRISFPLPILPYRSSAAGSEKRGRIRWGAAFFCGGRGGGGEEVHWEFCYSEAAPFGIVPFLFQEGGRGSKDLRDHFIFTNTRGRGATGKGNDEAI